MPGTHIMNNRAQTIDNNNFLMISIIELKLEDILGLWENDDYTLVITPKTITLSSKTQTTYVEKEPIIWRHCLDDKNKILHNTIQVSKNIYIYQLNENSLDEFVILYNDNYHPFHRVSFFNEFKFYRSRIDIHKYIAIRWHNPWEYVALVEFQDFHIKRILQGDVQEERSEICNYHTDISTFPDNWTEIEFRTCFPDYHQKAIQKTIKDKLDISKVKY